MTAFNVVRFRVKPGRDQEFLDAHNSIGGNWPGIRHVNIIKTGDRTYCIIAEWTDYGRDRQRAAADDRDAEFVPGHAGGSGRRAGRH